MKHWQFVFILPQGYRGGAEFVLYYLTICPLSSNRTKKNTELNSITLLNSIKFLLS